MKIGVFGTWRAQPGDDMYSAAHQVGYLASLNGFQIVTGGYSGIMEAACRGAVEGGGNPLGVLCPEINAILPPNQWVQEKIKARNLGERVFLCLDLCDATVFFPGRTGTVNELTAAVELRSKGQLNYPIVLMGNFWESFFHWLASSNERLGYQQEQDMDTIYKIAYTPNEAMNIISK